MSRIIGLDQALVWQDFVPAGPLVGSSGIPEGLAFGTGGSVALESELIGGSGIVTGLAFGSGGEVVRYLTGATGLASSLAFGATGSATGPVTGSAGIASDLAFGVGGDCRFSVDGYLGLESELTFGVGGYVLGPITGQVGIVSGLVFGLGGVVAGPLTGTVGIASALTFGNGGTASITGPINGSAGIVAGLAFGTGGLVYYLIAGASGIASGLTFGSGGDVRVGIDGYVGISSGLTFGAGGLVGNDGTFALYVRQKDITAILLTDTLQVTYDMTAASLASFALISLSGSYLPPTGAEVVYTFGGKKIFGGKIIKTVVKPYDSTRRTRIEVQCAGYDRILQDRVYTRTWTGPTLDFYTIMRDIVDVGLAGDKLTYAVGSETSTITAKRLEFAGDTVQQCFDRMKAAFGYNIWVDADRVIHAERGRWQIAPYQLRNQFSSDGMRSAVWASMEITRDSTQYRNVQGVRTAIPVAGQQTSTFHGDGASRSWTLTQPAKSKPAVKVNTVSKVVVENADRGTQPYDFYYFRNERTIYQNGSAALLTSGDTIEVVFPAACLDVCVTENTDAIAANALITGDSGIVQATTPGRNVRDHAAAVAVNATQLAKYGARSITNVQFISRRPYWEVGQVVHAFITAPHLAGWFQIKALSVREIGCTYLEYQIQMQAPTPPDITSVDVVDNGDGTFTVTVDTGSTDLGLNPGETFTLSGLGPGGGSLTPPNEIAVVHIVTLVSNFVSGQWELTVITDVYCGAGAGDPVVIGNCVIQANHGTDPDFGQPENAINGGWICHSSDSTTKTVVIRTGADGNLPVDFTGLFYTNSPQGTISSDASISGGLGTGAPPEGIHVMNMTIAGIGADWEVTLTLDEWPGLLIGDVIALSNMQIQASNPGLSAGSPTTRINGQWAVHSVDRAAKTLTFQTNHDSNPVCDLIGFAYLNPGEGLLAVAGASGSISGSWTASSSSGGSVTFTTGQTCNILAVILTAGATPDTWSVKLMLDQIPQTTVGDSMSIDSEKHHFTSAPAPGDQSDRASRRRFAAVNGINGSWSVGFVPASPNQFIVFDTNSGGRNGPLDLTDYVYDGGGQARFTAANGNAALTPGNIDGSVGTIYTGQPALPFTPEGQTNPTSKAGTPIHRIIAVDNQTAEVTTADAHGFSTNYPVAHGDEVCIFGCTTPEHINIAFTRVTVTSPTTFIAEDVDGFALKFDLVFTNDGHGGCFNTRQSMNVSSGPHEIIQQLHGVLAGNTNTDMQVLTFILANSVPGLPTRPLTTGENQTATITYQRDIGVVDSISALIGTPSENADVLIDIKQNGVSILPAGQYVTLPAGQTDPVRVTEFVNNPQVVEQGDKFTMDVIQTGAAGSGFPGCNAVVNLNVRG